MVFTFILFKLASTVCSVQLNLEQHGFELYEPIYLWNFFQ